MKDIVIPYLRNKSGELETCISLIKKNVPHRKIHVVENYDRTPFHNISHINQILKLKWAIENLDITDEFYLFNDDFFVLEPVAEIQYFHRGTLTDHLATRNGGNYTAAIRYTREYLSDDAISYELHVPFLFDKKKLYSLVNYLEPNVNSFKCPLIRSTYGNRFDVGGEYMRDVKNVQDYADKPYLSTTEQSFKRSIGDYIRSQV